MAKQLRTADVLAEDLSSVDVTPIIPVCNLNSREFDILFWLPWTYSCTSGFHGFLHVHSTHTYTQVHI